MPFPNKIAVRCKVCNEPVAVGTGWTEGPPWVTKCQKCSGHVEAPLKIVVTREGNEVVFKPNAFLGGDKFGTYLKCVEGGRFEPTRKAQIAPLGKVAPMIEKLRATGFTVDVEPSLSAHLQALTAQQKLMIQSAGARADKIDAILKARGQTLFPFQRIGVEWLSSKYGGLLADEMGLGKTIQALAALPDNAPVLVISPALAKGVWRREAKKWRPDYTPVVLNGHGSFRWPQPGEIVIINFDLLPDPSAEKHPLPYGVHDGLCGKSGVVDVVPGDVLQFKGKSGSKFFAMVEMTDNGTDWFTVCLWDETTPAGDVRLYRVPWDIEIKKPQPPLLASDGHPRQGTFFRPKQARVSWSTVVPVTFGVLLKPKDKPKQVEAIEAPEGIVLIVDEAHAFKSNKAARTMKFRAISEGVRKNLGRVWGLTGTPLLNKQQELWTVLSALGCAQDAFGSWKKFAELFGGYQDTYGYVFPESPPDPEAVGDRLKRVMLRRLRKEVLPQLPVKTWTDIPVDIDAKTTKQLDAVLAKMVGVAKERSSRRSKKAADAALDLFDCILPPEGEGTDEERQTILDRIRSAIESSKGSVTSLPGFEEISKARALLATAKIPGMLSIIEGYEEQEEPLVVFSAHREPIDALKGRVGWALITGSTASEERTRIEDDFQAGKLKGVACTIKAGGVAITLTRSHTALFVDREWTPALNDQAEDRICRIGQDRGCVILRLIAEHAIDKRVFELLEIKQNIISNTIEMGRQSNPDVTVVELDLERMASQAREEAEAADKARAEAQKLAEERAKHYANEREREEAEAKERKEREVQEKKDAKARERAQKRGWVAPADAPERHEARTPRQLWAANALVQLTSDDPDFASTMNGVGFNKSDAVVGHWLSQELSKGFTPKQWGLVVHLCAKYHGQVGEMPEKDGSDHADVH
jgi:SNF2 family DNA or RNA helicase